MTAAALDFDTVLELCSEKHRRIVLAVLAGHERPLTMQDLTKAVVKHNHHAPLSEQSGDVTTRIQRSLYHVHVPKLEAEGVVDYDPERQVVTPTGLDRVQPALSAILDADPDLELPVVL